MKSDSGNAKAHDGFTLVEMLVVISIIGILVAMLLPAVQAARESGRSAQCNNNLKQIGLACLCHDEALGVLPDGGEWSWQSRTMYPTLVYSQVTAGAPTAAGQQYWGWGYQILPYTDLAALWGLTGGGNPYPPDVKDPAIYGTPIPMYFCPTRRRPQALSGSSTPGTGRNDTRAMIDYAGNGGTNQSGDQCPTGSTSPGCNNNTGVPDGWADQGDGLDGVIVRRPNGDTFNGIAQRSMPISAANIPDGASNTMMIAEKNFNIGRLGYWQPEDAAGFVDGWGFDTIRWGCNPPQPDQNAPLDTYSTSNNSTYRSAAQRGSFGSSHPGRFNSVFADGHVRGIGFYIDLNVFKEVSSRNDGQVFNLSDL